MDKIDTTTEHYNDAAKITRPEPDAKLLAEIVSKINEIIDWINSQ